MKTAALLGMALLAAGCSGGGGSPALELTLAAHDTHDIRLPVTLRPCEGDSLWLLEGTAEGHGALALLRTDSIRPGSYPLGTPNELVIRYHRPGVPMLVRADSGALTLSGAPFHVSIGATAVDAQTAVRYRVNGSAAAVRPDSTHVPCKS